MRWRLRIRGSNWGGGTHDRGLNQRDMERWFPVWLENGWHLDRVTDNFIALHSHKVWMFFRREG